MIARLRVLCFLLVVTAVARAEDRKHVFERPLMGTRFAITCHGPDEAAARKAADEAFAAGEEVNRIASDYLPDSELMSLRVGKTFKVTPLFAELLDASFRFARTTDGAFDPTLGPLSRQWRETRRTRQLPAPEVFAKARDASGWQHATWDAAASTILLEKPGMQLDLGGIAKGFAADRMLAVMVKAGFSRTCIAAGGDLRMGDPPPGKTAWRIGLQTFDADEPEEVVELSNCAVSTSGDLHQFVEIEGKRYSHILDPATGLGLTGRIAVSVIAKDATTSDALATAACVAGPEKAEALALEAGATRVIVRTPRAQGASIRVATYNVEFGTNATAEQIGTMLKPYRFDVIGFTEAPGGDWGQRVGAVLEMPHQFRSQTSSANHKDKYKLILSRTPLEDAREIPLPGSGWQPASAVRAVSGINGVRCAIYVLHVCASRDETGQAYHLADEILSKDAEASVIAMGDFNNQLADPPMRHLREAGMAAIWESLPVDLSQAFTWNARDPKQREGVIDHILFKASPRAVVTAGGIIELEQPLSDHKPVWAELRMP